MKRKKRMKRKKFPQTAMQPLLLFLLLILIGSSSSSTHEESSPRGDLSPLLLIVGDVQPSSARILLQHVDLKTLLPSNLIGWFYTEIYQLDPPVAEATWLNIATESFPSEEDLRKFEIRGGEGGEGEGGLGKFVNEGDEEGEEEDEEEGRKEALQPSLKLVGTQRITAQIDSPSLLVLDDHVIRPASQYFVKVIFIEEADLFTSAESQAERVLKDAQLKMESRGELVDFVSFRSFDSAQEGLELAVVSCNRYFEDDDEKFLRVLAKGTRARHATVHLGDQIYADAVGKNFVPGSESYSGLLDKFRHIYLKTWMNKPMQTILRHSANWMIPDDHDFANNADDSLMETHLAEVLLAGRQAFFEYQFQLVKNITTQEGLPTQEVANSEVYFTRVVGNTAMAFVDCRVHRTFHPEPASPFFGKYQIDDLKEKLPQWHADPAIQHVFIFSPTPFFISPESSANLVYFMEKEKLPAHPHLINSTDEFLRLLLPYRSKIHVIGGDIHAYLNTSLCLRRNEDVSPTECLRQISTSGITNGSAVINSLKLTIFTATWTYLTTRRVLDWEYNHHDVYLGENFVTISIQGGERTLTLVTQELSDSQRLIAFLFKNTAIIFHSTCALLVLFLLNKFLK